MPAPIYRRAAEALLSTSSSSNAPVLDNAVDTRLGELEQYEPTAEELEACVGRYGVFGYYDVAFTRNGRTLRTDYGEMGDLLPVAPYEFVAARYLPGERLRFLKSADAKAASAVYVSLTLHSRFEGELLVQQGGIAGQRLVGGGAGADDHVDVVEGQARRGEGLAGRAGAQLGGGAAFDVPHPDAGALLDRAVREPEALVHRGAGEGLVGPHRAGAEDPQGAGSESRHGDEDSQTGWSKRSRSVLWWLRCERRAAFSGG